MDKFADPIETLKDKLQNATNTSDIQAYFFDHLAEKQAFLKLGKPCKDKDLRPLLKKVAKRLYGDNAQAEQMMLVCVKRYGLVHGPLTIGGYLANVIYFRSLGMGLLAVAKSFSTGEMSYIRFTRFDLGHKAIPMPGPETLQ